MISVYLLLDYVLPPGIDAVKKNSHGMAFFLHVVRLLLHSICFQRVEGREKGDAT